VKGDDSGDQRAQSTREHSAPTGNDVGRADQQPSSFLTAYADGVLLAIKLQPRAATNEIGEPLGAELRVRVTAPPVDAAANEALLRLLATTLDCPRGQVELVRGHTSRHKVVKVYGVTMAGVWQRLRAL